MDCTFKLVYKNTTIPIFISQNLLICDLKQSIKKYVFEIMSLRSEEYDIIASGTHLKELADPIDLTSKKKLKTLNCVAFYIRPKNFTIPEINKPKTETNQNNIKSCISNDIINIRD
jgi:hypothetical protein